MNWKNKLVLLTIVLSTSVLADSPNDPRSEVFKQSFNGAQSIDLYEFQNFASEGVVCFASELSSNPKYPGTGVCLDAKFSPIVKIYANTYTLPAGKISAAKGAERDFKHGRPGIANLENGDFTFEEVDPFHSSQSLVVKIRRTLKSTGTPSYIIKKYFCNNLKVPRTCTPDENTYGIFEATPIDFRDR